jgi:hypothetical protein
MNEVMMLRGAEPRKILETAKKEEICAIMSYMSRGKWHVARVKIEDMKGDLFGIRLCPQKKAHPVNVKLDEQIGLSIKHEYGKFVFESRIVRLEPSENRHNGGKIILRIPREMDLVQRRYYYRVQVPKSLDVKAQMWKRNSDGDTSDEKVFEGELVDLSAGGLQVGCSKKLNPEFREGQFVLVRFTPLPSESPMTLSCQVRGVLPTADDQNICYGLQVVGLEASPEGRMTLTRLASVVGQYYEMNNSEMKSSSFANTSFKTTVAEH